MNVKIKRYKRTKILATVGPSTNSLDSIETLIKEGVNGIRLNFSHGSYEERAEQIKWIRYASKNLKKPVAILQDLQGPKIRLGELDEPIQVHRGDLLHFTHAKKNKDGLLPIQYDLSKKLKVGEPFLMVDGRIRGEVTDIKGDIITVKINHGGKLSSRKGINLPETDLMGDIITDKDREDVRFGADHDVDYVALSFVQTADDVNQLRSYMKKYGSDAKIIAKIETKAATENLDEIIEASDGVMVARGDLAIETEPESVPIIQRKIIGLAQTYGKISIVATQMLASMVDAPEPTRAEVSDVATAVILGTDTVMLSDETASGDFPEEAVAYMKRIILYTQENAPLKPLYFNDEDSSIKSSVSSAVMTLAHQVDARAIVAETASGDTARSIAAHRPSMPIIMVTHRDRVAQQLALVYGGKSFVRRRSRNVGERMTDWLKRNKILKSGDTVVITSGKYPGKIGGTDTIKVRRIE